MNANRRTLLQSLLCGGALLGFASSTAGVPGAQAAPAARPGGGYKVTHTDAEWRRLLSPEAYNVLRHQDTEAPWSSPLEYEHRKGIYSCAGCSLALYSSDTKFESGTGWPSFWQPLPHAIGTSVDKSLFEARTEVHCAQCGGHLGHVFSDGPKPTGLRYCMNGVALKFTPAAST